MCCFSRNVQRVANTQIFARATKDGKQVVVYSMILSAKEDLAMILPIPVPKKSAEDAVKFISLKGYADFFKDMVKGFPRGRGLNHEPKPGQGIPKDDAPLKVVAVGSFEASFVPTVKDFARLDERFRLPATTWDALPAYKEHGFAVFKLKSGEKHIHPMAFEFPRADKKRLFFPTVHIHDGKVHKTATFDHELYCQACEGENVMRWTESPSLAEAFMKIDRTKGLVEKTKHVYKVALRGKKANQDTLLA